MDAARPFVHLRMPTRSNRNTRHLFTLADLAAKSWRHLFEGKQRMPREMREALLENSLDVQRRYAEKAMRRDRAKNMKGFSGAAE